MMVVNAGIISNYYRVKACSRNARVESQSQNAKKFWNSKTNIVDLYVSMQVCWYLIMQVCKYVSMLVFNNASM